MSGQTQERVGFEAWLGIKPCGAAHDLAYEAFKAGAAWQRAQVAVPDGWKLVPINLTAEMVNGAWNEPEAGYANHIEKEWAGALNAAPAHPAERQEQEELHVWRATTRFGETCHFGEASAARAWAGENGTVERVDLTPVPELRAVERQEQGAVHSAAARDVLAERKRQITAEDFDASHDDMATRGQIAMAAGLYAIDAANLAAGRISLSRPSALWPWPEEWCKPAGSRRNLVKAGALILAEIERLDRAALAAGTGQEVE